MSRTVPSSKHLGDRAVAAIIQHVDGLEPVGDSDAEHFDAEPTVALWSSEIPMVGIAEVLDTEVVPVEYERRWSVGES